MPWRSMMRTFESLEDFAVIVGEEIGVTRWYEIDQQTIDAFADVSGDHQWIHVDRERAADGPWGSTIAHGFLTLSLLPSMLETIWRIEGVPAVINYGVDRVRFTSAVPVGSRLRARASLAGVEEHARGFRSRVKVVVEIDGSDRPACVAELLSLLMAA
jgi:acyl dehydratase